MFIKLGHQSCSRFVLLPRNHYSVIEYEKYSPIDLINELQIKITFGYVFLVLRYRYFRIHTRSDIEIFPFSYIFFLTKICNAPRQRMFFYGKIDP